MSMLTAQCENLRIMARLVRDYDYREISRELREAADTIESLRNRLTDQTCRIEKYDADPHGVFVGSPIVDDDGNETTIVEVYGYRCSECGGTLELKWSYCPSCGRRMVV